MNMISRIASIGLLATWGLLLVVFTGCGSSSPEVMTYTADNAPVVYKSVPEGATVHPSEAAAPRPEIEGESEALIREIEYPEADFDAGVEGLVYVSFIVGPEGDIYEPDIVGSVSPELDREAMRVLQAVEWNPGHFEGEPAYIEMEEFPVPFRLAEHQQPERQEPETMQPQPQPQPPTP